VKKVVVRTEKRIVTNVFLFSSVENRFGVIVYARVACVCATYSAASVCVVRTEKSGHAHAHNNNNNNNNNNTPVCVRHMCDVQSHGVLETTIICFLFSDGRIANPHNSGNRLRVVPFYIRSRFRYFRTEFRSENCNRPFLNLTGIRRIFPEQHAFIEFKTRRRGEVH